MSSAENFTQHAKHLVCLLQQDLLLVISFVHLLKAQHY